MLLACRREWPTAHLEAALTTRQLKVQEGLPLEQMLRHLERQIIEGTLRSLNNHREQTARTLRLARSSLFKRLKQWGHTQEEGEAS